MEEKKTRKKLGKKSIIAICLSSILLVGLLTTGLILFLTRDNFNLNNAVIKNITNYSALGVGTSEYTVENAKSFTDSSSKKYKNAKLYGVDKNTGKYEKIVFKNSNGNDVKQDWDVADFMACGAFSFITYTRGNRNSLNDNDIYLDDGNVEHGTYKAYIIHNKTGKIFSALGIFKTNYLNMSKTAYNDNVFYFVKQDKKLVKLSVENNKLKVEEIISIDKLNFRPSNMIVDNYNNLLLQSQNNDMSYYDDCYSYDYAITDSKELKVLGENERLFKSINGYVYSYDLTKKLGSNGELQANTDTIGYVNNEKMEYVSTINNVDYYFANVQYGRKELVKVEWIDNVNYNSTQLLSSNEIETTYSMPTKYIFTQDRIYFLDNQKITYLNLSTLEYRTLISDYVFYDIASDNKGNVYFEAINETLQDVSGIIKNNGDIDITISDNDFVVLYISPIN